MNLNLPSYTEIPYPMVPLASDEAMHIIRVVEFLKWVVERDQLEAANYLEQITQDPSFLVAATGLGKTVAMPVHALIRQAERTGTVSAPLPRVWVVEPRIPIAIDQCAFMNYLWETYHNERGRYNVPPLFGCISSVSGNLNPEAPIKFITTGVFEGKAEGGDFDPECDRIIVDEAHVTIPQSEKFELAIATTRNAGVTVDYMSATVDTTGLREALGIPTIIRADEQRHHIWKSNLLTSMEEGIVELLSETLIDPNPDGIYFPQDDYPHAAAVKQAVLEPGRSHGMLVAINTFAGEFSDAERLRTIIRKAFPALPTLLLASDIVRDSRRLDDFQHRLQQIHDAQQNYVIIATSVVEMGITFATLDYVALLDCNYDQETIGEATIPVIAPRDINSLLQMMGRVGRRRPGIAYISLEVGAEYAELEDDELNKPGTLACEPIRFPLAYGPLMPLAYYLCGTSPESLGDAVAALRLPSRIQDDPERMEYLREQIATLQQLGLAEGLTLTPLGKRMKPWVGRYDLAYAAHLQRRFEEDVAPGEFIFWLVACALSGVPIVTLRSRYSYFVDYLDEHHDTVHQVDFWPELPHEDITLFLALADIATLAPSLLFGATAESIDEDDLMELRRWCNGIGLDARKLRKVAACIADAWQLFVRHNSRTARFNAIFSGRDLSVLSRLPWQHVADGLPDDDVWSQLCNLPGATTVEFEFNKATGTFDWWDLQYDRSGMLSQDDTPLEIDPDITYVARVIPSRETKEDALAWRLSHLGEEFVEAEPDVPDEPVAEQEPPPAATPQPAPTPVQVPDEAMRRPDPDIDRLRQRIQRRSQRPPVITPPPTASWHIQPVKKPSLWQRFIAWLKQ